MKTILRSLLLACTLAALSFTAYTKTVVVFDIHGVLLKEDLGALVKKQVAALLQARRSLKNNEYFRMLCQLMEIHRPLGQPTPEYAAADYEIPFEVYALFSGLVSLETAQTALMDMVKTATLEDKPRLILTALLNALFEDEKRISSLTPIPSGIALFNACLASPDIEVYIYSNVPQQWVLQYKTLFPQVFKNISTDRILCSGETGLVKPSPAVLEYIAEKAGVAVTNIVLVDDSSANCAAAHVAGATGIHFITPVTPPANAS